MKTEEADGCTGAIVKGFDGKSGVVVVGVRLVEPAVVAGFVDKDVGSSAVTATDAATAEADAACAEVSVIGGIGAAAGSSADADVGSEHSAPSSEHAAPSPGAF